jgi:hypothetical protein
LTNYIYNIQYEKIKVNGNGKTVIFSEHILKKRNLFCSICLSRNVDMLRNAESRKGVMLTGEAGVLLLNTKEPIMGRR